MLPALVGTFPRAVYVDEDGGVFLVVFAVVYVGVDVLVHMFGCVSGLGTSSA